MGKKKADRRSVSLKGPTYRRLKALCRSKGQPVSGFLEALIAPLIEGITDPNPPPPPANPDDYFTF